MQIAASYLGTKKSFLFIVIVFFFHLVADGFSMGWMLWRR